jgi:hypothetical protein
MKKLTDGRRTLSDGNTSHDPLGQVSLKGQPNKLHYKNYRYYEWEILHTKTNYKTPYKNVEVTKLNIK